jgi:hypothetical protein
VLISDPVPQAPPQDPPVAPPPTKVTLAPPQTPATTEKTSAPGPCDDHFAELTNGKRVFHRLFVLGPTNDDKEKKISESVKSNVKSALTGAGRQAPGSSEASLTEPTLDEFTAQFKELMNKAKPCEEVTVWLGGHGAGGSETGVELPKNGTASDAEAKAELFHIGKGNGADAFLSDRYLGKLVKENLKPDVSLTFIMSTCWGGGFAGEGNVEESKLVQVIGLKGICASPTFDNALIKGLGELGGKSADKRVYAKNMKVHLAINGWDIGKPSDTSSNVPQGQGK